MSDERLEIKLDREMENYDLRYIVDLAIEYMYEHSEDEEDFEYALSRLQLDESTIELLKKVYFE